MAKRQFNDKPPPGGFVVLRPLPRLMIRDSRSPMMKSFLFGNDRVVFCDDGVGSSTFKPRAILGGAFGFAMFNRIILAAVMLAISTAGSAAKDEPTKEECPTLDHQEIEDLLRKAPSCQRAGALFEICQFGASGDVSLGAIVTEKCEGDFLSKLNAAQRRAYDREQKRCQRKYAHEDGTM